MSEPVFTTAMLLGNAMFLVLIITKKLKFFCLLVNCFFSFVALVAMFNSQLIRYECKETL